MGDRNRSDYDYNLKKAYREAKNRNLTKLDYKTFSEKMTTGPGYRGLIYNDFKKAGVEMPGSRGEFDALFVPTNVVRGQNSVYNRNMKAQGGGSFSGVTDLVRNSKKATATQAQQKRSQQQAAVGLQNFGGQNASSSQQDTTTYKPMQWGSQPQQNAAEQQQEEVQQQNQQQPQLGSGDGSILIDRNRRPNKINMPSITRLDSERRKVMGKQMQVNVSDRDAEKRDKTEAQYGPTAEQRASMPEGYFDEVNENTGLTRGQMISNVNKAVHDLEGVNTKKFDEQTNSEIKSILDAANAQANEIWKNDKQESPFLGARYNFNMGTAQRANEVKDPDKLLQTTFDAFNKNINAYLQQNQQSLANKAEQLGIDYEDYANMVAESMGKRLQANFEKELETRNMPKNDFEYIMSGMENWVPSLIYRAATETPGQFARKEAAREKYGENASGWAKFGRGAVEFTDPTFAMSFGAGSAVGHGAANLASKAIVKGATTKIGQRVAKNVLSKGIQRSINYATKFGTKAEARMASIIGQNSATKIGAFAKTYAKNLPAEMLGQGLGMNIYGAQTAALQTYGAGTYNQHTGRTERSVLDAGRAAWDGLTSKEGFLSGAGFAIAMPWIHGTYGMYGGWKQGASKANKVMWGVGKTAYEGLGIGATAGVMLATNNIGKWMNGEEMDWTVNAYIDETAVAAAMKLNPTMLKNLGNIKYYGSKATNDPLQFRLTQAQRNEVCHYMGTGHDFGEAMRQLFPDYEKSGGKATKADVQQAQQRFLELMNNVSWETQNKLAMGLTGSMTLMRPRRATFDFKDGVLYEKDSNGKVLSTKEFKTEEEKNAYMEQQNMFQHNLDMMDSYSAVLMKDSENKKKDKNAPSELERIFAESSAETGMSISDMQRAINKEPARRTEREREALSDLTRRLHDTAYPKGEVHVEASHDDGVEAAKSAKIADKEPDVSAIEGVSQECYEAGVAFHEAMQDAEWREDFQNLVTQGYRIEEIYEILTNPDGRYGFNEADLAPLADYINAQHKQEGILDGAQQEIDTKTNNFVSIVFGGTADTENGVAVINDGTGEYYIVEGKVEVDRRGYLTSANTLGLIKVGGDGEIEYRMFGDGVKIERRETEDEVRARYDEMVTRRVAEVIQPGSTTAGEAQPMQEGGAPAAKPQGETRTDNTGATVRENRFGETVDADRPGDNAAEKYFDRLSDELGIDISDPNAADAVTEDNAQTIHKLLEKFKTNVLDRGFEPSEMEQSALDTIADKVAEVESKMAEAENNSVDVSDLYKRGNKAEEVEDLYKRRGEGGETVVDEDTNAASQEVVMDEKGNPDVTAEGFSAARTLEHLKKNTGLSEEEVNEYINDTLKEAKTEFNKVSSKTPKLKGSLTERAEAKAKHEAELKDAKAKLDGWQAIYDEAHKFDRNEDAADDATSENELREAMEGFEDDPQMIMCANMPRITPESYYKETGLSGKDRPAFWLAGKGKGGKTIDEAVLALREALADNGIVNYDESDIRNFIIDAISNGGPRSYAKRLREDFESQAEEGLRQHEQNLKEEWAQQHFGMTFSEWEDYEESVFDSTKAKYEGVDENELAGHMAEELKKVTNTTLGEIVDPNRKGHKQINKAIKNLGEALEAFNNEESEKNAKAILNAVNTFIQNVSAGAKPTKAESMYVLDAEDKLLEKGYEIRELRGEKYDEGMKVIADFIHDENLEPGEKIIKSVRKPLILKDGVMIQAAEITVKLSPYDTIEEKREAERMERERRNADEEGNNEQSKIENNGEQDGRIKEGGNVLQGTGSGKSEGNVSGVKSGRENESGNTLQDKNGSVSDGASGDGIEKKSQDAISGIHRGTKIQNGKGGKYLIVETVNDKEIETTAYLADGRPVDTVVTPIEKFKEELASGRYVVGERDSSIETRINNLLEFAKRRYADEPDMLDFEYRSEVESLSDNELKELLNAKDSKLAKTASAELEKRDVVETPSKEDVKRAELVQYGYDSIMKTVRNGRVYSREELEKGIAESEKSIADAKSGKLDVEDVERHVAATEGWIKAYKELLGKLDAENASAEPKETGAGYKVGDKVFMPNSVDGKSFDEMTITKVDGGMYRIESVDGSRFMLVREKDLKRYAKEYEKFQKDNGNEKSYGERVEEAKVTDKDIVDVLGDDSMLEAVKDAIEKAKKGEALSQVEEGLLKAILYNKESAGGSTTDKTADKGTTEPSDYERMRTVLDGMSYLEIREKSYGLDKSAPNYEEVKRAFDEMLEEAALRDAYDWIMNKSRANDPVKALERKFGWTHEYAIEMSKRVFDKRREETDAELQSGDTVIYKGEERKIRGFGENDTVIFGDGKSAKISEVKKVPEHNIKSVDATRAQLKANVESAAKEAMDALRDFFNPKSDGNAYGMLVPVTPQQIKAFPRAVNAVGKLGYALIKLGAHDFKEWSNGVVERMGDFFRNTLGWDDKNISDFLKEMWEIKFKMGDEVHTIKEWAEAEKKNFENNLTEGSKEYVEKDKAKSAFVDKVRQTMEDMTLTGERKTLGIRELRKWAEECGLKDVKDTDLQEFAEFAAVKAARHIVEVNGFTKDTYESIVDLYENQPVLNMRDTDRIMLQQYSTPTPFAFVMGMFARYKKAIGSVLEPSAGNGSLTICFEPRTVHANDIDQQRIANLREHNFKAVTTQDGTKPFEDKDVDVVITNPPFGTTTPRDYDGWTITSLEGQMAINALNSMASNGRAAIVIGGNTEYTDSGVIKGSKDKAFLGYLYENYNVIDVINLSGDLYRKNGTTYPTRMILIDGRRSEANKMVPHFAPIKSKARAEQVKTFEELFNRVKDETQQLKERKPEPVNNNGADRPVDRGENRPDVNRDGGRVRGGGERQPLGDSTGRGPRKPELSTSGDATNEPKSGVRSGGRGKVADGGVRNAELPHSGEKPSDGGERTDTNGGRTTDAGRMVDGAQSGNVSAGNGGRVTPSASANGTVPEPVKPKEKVTLNTEKVSYIGRSKSGEIGSVVPANQAEALDKVLNEFDDIDQYLVEKCGYSSKDELFSCLAKEQVDSVALAIKKMENGGAFIIGDMTGVGKGRQAAALIRYAVKSGKKPIFVTVKPELFADIYRDLCDVGSKELRPLIINKDKSEMTDATGKVVYKKPTDAELNKAFSYIEKHGELPKEYDYVVVTYSQFGNGNMDYSANKKEERKQAGKKNGKAPTLKTLAVQKAYQRRKDVIEILAENNIIIMDESHNAAGEAKQAGFKKKDKEESADVIQSAGSGVSAFMQYLVPKASGVTFLSATYAKRAGNMPLYALKTAMSKAGVSSAELINAIVKGGTTLQEIMSKALTASGEMIRRERDFSGVTIDWTPAAESDAEIADYRQRFDTVASLAGEIIRFQREFVGQAIRDLADQLAEIQTDVEHTPGTNDMGINNAPFASKLYNLTQQLLFSLKAKTVAQRAIQEIKEGRHPVIAVNNTMEGFVNDIMEGQSMEMPDMSSSLLEGLRGVLRYQTKDQKGSETYSSFNPSDLGTAGEKRYYELEDKIKKTSSGLSVSPIDVIKNELKKAGYSVGELTGRKSEFVYNEDGTVQKVKRSDRDKKKIAREFNAGKIDVVILNKSAGTGISLHSSTKFADQRQRVMIFAQMQPDINDEVQMRGRIDRTGQVHRGKYVYIVSPVPAEQRLMMMFKAKLKSLDANTTASQKSKFNEMQLEDIMNKYGSQVAVEYFLEHRDAYDEFGTDPFGWGSGENLFTSNDEQLKGNVKADNPIGKITGHLTILPCEVQEKILQDLSDAYKVKIDALNDAGENDLEIKDIPLRAKTISKEIWKLGADPGSGNAFADNTYIEEVECDVLKKPYKREEIGKMSARMADNKPWEEFVEDKAQEIDEYYANVIAEADKKNEESANIRAEREYEKYKAAATKARDAKKEGWEDKTDDDIENLAQIQKKNVYDEQRKKQEAHAAAIRYRTERMIEALHQFEPGQILIIPQSFDSAESTFTPSIGTLVGFKFNKTFSKSASTVVFATLDSRRRVEIPLSKMEQLSLIGRHTMMGTNYIKDMTMDKWDSKVPTNTRQKRIIVTGNILGALVGTENRKGQLISYTTEEGDVKQGVLMPENFESSSLTNKKPISSQLQQIRNGNLVTGNDKEGNEVSIKSEGVRSSSYVLYVPKAKNKGGKYFLDRELCDLTVAEFTSVGNRMRANVEKHNLPAVLDKLSKMGVSVEEKREDGSRLSEDLDRNITEDMKAGGENDICPAFKNNRGTTIKRGGTLGGVKYNVGKVMMGKLYIHKDYAENALPDGVLEKAEKYLPEGFEYNAVCWNPKEPNIVRFDECPNFDTVANPRVGKQFGVNIETGEPIYKTKDGSGIRNEQQIFHDKWQWVDNDYQGFDVKDSYDWSKEYNAKIDGTPNGRTNKWEEQLENAGLKDKDEEIRYKTSEELDKEYPGWRNQTNPKGANEGGHSTQITSTRKTYQKVGKWMLDNGMKDAEVLDASSGLGFGTLDMREMGLNVEDVEPFAGKGRQEAPTYTSYDEIDKQYDLVVSNAVLNVIPDDWRADVLKSMADKVKPGGKMFINCLNAVSLGKNTKVLGTRANGKPNEVLTMWDAEHYRSYQHIYSAKELGDYVKEQLGDGWKVETAKKAGIDSSDAIMVTRETEAVPTYREVPADVWKAEGVGKAPEKKTEVHKHIETISSELNENVNMHDNISTVDNAKAKKAIREGRKIMGWWDAKTNSVHLWMPNIKSKYQAEKTIVHETVGHKGLRGLLKGQYNKFMDMIWADKKNTALHDFIKKYAPTHSWEIYEGIDEWLAREAEKDVTPENLSMWGRIKNFFEKTLREIGYRWKPNINDVRYIIWLSKNYGKNPDDPLFKARANALRWKMEHEKFEPATMDGMYVDSADVRLSEDLDTENETTERKAVREQLNERFRSRAFRYHEAFIDSAQALRDTQEKISGKGIYDIKDAENAYIAENHMSSISEAEWNKFKVQKFQPVEKATNDCVGLLGGKAAEAREAMDMYAYEKHGLERNRRMYVAETLEAYAKSAEGMIAEKNYREMLKLGLSPDDMADMDKDIETADRKWSKYGDAEAKAYKELIDDKIDYAEYLHYLDEAIREHIDAGYDANTNDKSGISEFDENRVVKGGKVESFNEDKIIEDVMSMEDNLGKERVDNFWNAVKDATDFGVDYSYNCGQADKGSRDVIKSMYHWYVPLRGYKADKMEDIYGDRYSSNGNNYVGKILQKAHGRISLADSPLATISAMASSAINRGERNKVIQKFYRMVANNPNDAVKISESWVEDKNANIVDGKNVNLNPKWETAIPEIPEDATSAQIADILDAFTQRMEALEAQGAAQKNLSRPKYETGFKFKSNSNTHAVDVYINGRRKTMWFVGDPRAAQVLRGEVVNDNKTNTNRVFRWMMNTTASLATSYSPEFILSNLERDTLFSSANIASKESAAYFAKFSLNQAKAAALMGFSGIGGDWKINGETYGKESVFEKYYRGHEPSNNLEKMFFEFMDNGGKTGFIAQQQLEKSKKELKGHIKGTRIDAKGMDAIKGILTLIPKGIEQLNMRAELVNRFATYLTSRQMGRTKLRCVADAKEVSVNFNRHGGGSASEGLAGNMAATMRNNFMFFNAGMQSMELLYRNISKDKSTAIKTISYMGAVPAILGAMFASVLANDDENYAKIPSYDRRNCICIPYSDEGYVKVALPIELRAFWGMGDIIASIDNPSLRTDESPAFAMMGQISQMLPVDILEPGEKNMSKPSGWISLLPTNYRPIAQYFANQDWTGRKIEKEDFGRTKTPYWTKAYPSVPDVLVEVCKFAHNTLRNGTSTNQETDTSGDSFLIDPSMWNHLLKSYFSGGYSLVSKSINMFTKNSDNPSRWPMVSRVIGGFSEKEADTTTNVRFFSYKEEHDRLIKQLADPNNSAERNVMGRVELENSVEFKRAKVGHQIYKDIDELNELKNSTTNEEIKNHCNIMIKEKKEALLKALDEIQ